MADAARALQLKARGVLRIAGTDAEKLLNGILTIDLIRIAGDGARYGALLTPQGKILFDFIIVAAPAGGYYVECNMDLLPDFAKRLSVYRLRADVRIDNISENHAVIAVPAAISASVPGAVAQYRDPRLAAMGFRAIILKDDLDAAARELEVTSLQAYEASRIGLGIPEGGRDFLYGDSFPHEAMLDQLSGVDFDKGCYVGQEVVSRMMHRGTVRTRILKVRAQTGLLPKAGMEITSGGRVIGRMGSSTGMDGLALVRLDRASTALTDGAEIVAEGVIISLEKPDYARFDFPLPLVEAKADT